MVGVIGHAGNAVVDLADGVGVGSRRLKGDAAEAAGVPPRDGDLRVLRGRRALAERHGKAHFSSVIIAAIGIRLSDLDRVVHLNGCIGGVIAVGIGEVRREVLAPLFDLGVENVGGGTVDRGFPRCLVQPVGVLLNPADCAYRQVGDGEGLAVLEGHDVGIAIVVVVVLCKVKLLVSGLFHVIGDAAACQRQRIRQRGLLAFQREVEGKYPIEVGRLTARFGGHGLADGQRADRLVLHDDRGLPGKQGRDVRIPQIPLVAVGRAVIILLHPEPAPAGIRHPGLVVLILIQGLIAQNAGFLIVLLVHRQAAGDPRSRQVQRAAGAGELGRHHIGQRAVDPIGEGVLSHAAHQRACIQRNGHAVISSSGICQHAVLIDDDGGEGGVDPAALRGSRFHQIVFAFGQIVAGGGEIRHAGGAGGRGVVRLRAPFKGIGQLLGFFRAAADDDILTFIEGKLRIGKRLAIGIRFLDMEVVSHVGDIDGGGELPLEVLAVHLVGILRGGLIQRFGLSIIVGDGIGGVIQIGLILFLQPEVIVPHIAGAVIQLRHVGAVAARRENEIVLGGVGLVVDHVQNGGNVAVAGGGGDVPAIKGVAGHDAPAVFGGRRMIAHAVQTPHDDGEHQAAGADVFAAIWNRLSLRAPQHDVGVGVNGLLGLGVGARLPLVVDIVEQKQIAVVVLQMEIDIPHGLVAGAVAVLPQKQMLNALLVQFVQADGGVLAVVEDEPAVRACLAASQNAVLIHALGGVHLIAGLAARGGLGGVEGKVHAGEGVAVLVDLHALGLRHMGQIELHGQIGVRAAPLQIEQLHGMVGVVGKGIAVPGAAIAVILGHLTL